MNPSDTADMKVLIIDDSAIIRERLVKLCATIAETVTAVEGTNVSRAMHSLKVVDPDVVILDMNLWEGSGGIVLRNIKSGPGIPVVIMFTSYSHPQYRQRCMDLGADFFFDKFTELDKLIHVLKTLVRDCHKNGFKAIQELA